MGYEVPYKALDKGASELPGPYGLPRGLSRIARKIGSPESGWVAHHALVLSVGSTIRIKINGPWDFVRYRVDNRSYRSYALLRVGASRLSPQPPQPAGQEA